MTLPWGRFVLILLGLVCASVIGPAAREFGRTSGGTADSVELVNADPVRATPGRAIPAGEFERLDPTKPEPWQASFSDPPQPLGEYRKTAPPLPTGDRRTLVIQPIGDFSPEQKKLVGQLREYAEAFFQVPARVAPAIDLPSNSEWQRVKTLGRERRVRQYNADYLLPALLADRMPKDALAHLGVTISDLWSGDLNFVFGLGMERPQAGLFSLHRYYPSFWEQVPRPGDGVQVLRRACKVLSHEGGHALGLTHCAYFRCAMNGSNSLRERDATPIHFCPVCLDKLRWYLGLDATRRYEAIGKFYDRYGLEEEARWVTAHLQRASE
jgi:archaemetzincin